MIVNVNLTLDIKNDKDDSTLIAEQVNIWIKKLLENREYCGLDILENDIGEFTKSIEVNNSSNEKGWMCFHCGKVFIDPIEAEEHFGLRGFGGTTSCLRDALHHIVLNHFMTADQSEKFPTLLDIVKMANDEIINQKTQNKNNHVFINSLLKRFVSCGNCPVNQKSPCVHRWLSEDCVETLKILVL